MQTRPVVLIIAHKESLSLNEKSSLVQCFAVLGKHAIKLICPRGLNVSTYKALVPAAEIDFIDPDWQSTYAKFNELKCSSFLFDRYKAFSHILFYELDAWVFRDELLYWCSKPIDYIGAPWFEGWNGAKLNSEFAGVGNGGFSLRNVHSSRRVIRRHKFLRQFRTYYSKLQFQQIRSFEKASLFFRKLIKLKDGKDLNIFLNTVTPHEDFYWSAEVPEYFYDFKIASIEEAIPFSFEVNPSRLYGMNNQQLPFGCHAWEKCEPEFWKPFILPGINVISL